MFNHFFKYQSLGNDFIVFDWYKRPSQYLDKELNDAAWPDVVQRLCDRHVGIGADGVLIVKNNPQLGLPEMLIFNSDGSSAQSCLNGLRCIAQHLRMTHRYPEKFSIKLNDAVIECSFLEDNQTTLISSHIKTIQLHGMQEITTDAGTFRGHVASVGNPHFIIFQQVSQEWLACHGYAIEQHPSFPDRTNVEFITQDPLCKTSYQMNIYERGCGITLACSSGAAALAALLVEQSMVSLGEQITICMPGGSVRAKVVLPHEVILQAEAVRVFEGSLPDYLPKLISTQKNERISIY